MYQLIDNTLAWLNMKPGYWINETVYSHPNENITFQ